MTPQELLQPAASYDQLEEALFNDEAYLKLKNN